MIKDLEIVAKDRQLLGKKVKTIRQEGKLPAVVYGKGKEAENLLINKNDFVKTYQRAGKTTLLSLAIDSKEAVKVLIYDVQKHPVTNELLHVDFYQVKMDEKIAIDVPLLFEGQSKAVEEKDANLVKNKDTVRIEALPNDLIHEIKVDISALENFGDSISVKDLKVGEKIEILDDPSEIVVLAQEPISEEELEEMEEEAAVDAEKAQIEKMEEEAEKAKEEVSEEEVPTEEPQAEIKPEEPQPTSEKKQE